MAVVTKGAGVMVGVAFGAGAGGRSVLTAGIPGAGSGGALAPGATGAGGAGSLDSER